MQKTGIEWCDYSSNPIRARNRATGKKGWACTQVSPGCDNCYSATLNRRWGTGLSYDKASGEAVEWWLNEAELATIAKAPITGVKVFVGDMTDIFHEQVQRAWLDRLFAVFALRFDLTFQILTKRPQRMRNYFLDAETRVRVAIAASNQWNQLSNRERDRLLPSLLDKPLLWPLPNVWVGTSVEDQAVAHRIKPLLETPAVVHFLSCEPLIGPLDLDPWLWESAGPAWAGSNLRNPGIDWVIVGGESGAGHRPLDLGWVRKLRDQCYRADTPFFFKQVGGPTPKAGGRELDGRTWDEMPEPREWVGA